MLAKTMTTIIATAAIGIASAGSAYADAGKEIKIGFAVAMSGWLQAYDGEALKMAQLWIEQQNAKGGLLGRPITGTIVDTKTDRVEGAKAGQLLVHDGVELLVVSADYDFGAPAALQAQKAGLISVFLGGGGHQGRHPGRRPLRLHDHDHGAARGRHDGGLGLRQARFSQGLRPARQHAGISQIDVRRV